MLKEFDLELKAKHKADYVVGMDETGRGSMVFSLVAACVILPDDYYNPKITDSKKLSHTQLEEFEKEIKENALFYHIVEYDNSAIDTIGIQQINISAFIQLKDIAESKYKNIINLVDGNIMKNHRGFLSFEKGDSKSFSIACASILAKTHRDRSIIDLAREYPHWNLEINKGYGVDYINHVKDNGYPNKIHRFSYKIKDDKQIKLF